jgi:hypothetical protein
MVTGALSDPSVFACEWLGLAQSSPLTDAFCVAIWREQVYCFLKNAVLKYGIRAM